MVIREKIQLSLQFIEIFNRANLPRLHQPFLLVQVQGHRLNRPSALLQADRGLLSVSLIGEKEVVVQRLGVSQRLVQLFVSSQNVGGGSPAAIEYS